MGIVRISLFGQLRIELGEQVESDLGSHKAQELLCYLALHPHQPQSREALVETLWSDGSPAQSRKQLRQALWHLQSALSACTGASGALLLVDPKWIAINPAAELWVDACEFERVYDQVRLTPGADLGEECVCQMQHVVGLYRGDLLEGWYQDWCLLARERLQNMYLSLLDQLIGYCLAHAAYSDALEYGECVLRIDPAHERTHQHLMRLHFKNGDRVAALRQYERCAAALRRELDVDPSEDTQALLHLIRTSADGAPVQVVPSASNATVPVHEAIDNLRHLHAALSAMQSQVQQHLQALERIISPRP